MNDQQPAGQVLRLQDVSNQTTLHRQTIWRWAKAGKFPKPFTLGGGRCVAWLQSDIDAWLAEQVARSTEASK